ncbi:hypothetical protein KC19_12G063400 [Ceratodon purpureus]|uniref:Transmembrane protein n=1 Tax=Ceratodon purpureus TaxID=3225 RepID=A0A8T0G7W7_CERPU|nr:hypothetical protein KC19_12G063400 [Ceratodon purpureus]
MMFVTHDALLSASYPLLLLLPRSESPKHIQLPFTIVFVICLFIVITSAGSNLGRLFCEFFWKLGFFFQGLLGWLWSELVEFVCVDEIGLISVVVLEVVMIWE